MNIIDVPEPERMADETDRAANIDRMATEEAINRALHRMEKAPADFDGRRCIDCDELIPEARLATGAFRDIHCQQRHEAKNKNHRSHYE